ncbi:MAG: cbb3-type cytochrome c oxidase subunit I [Bacteroidetes bacterium]|nr:cbb3-type cytochrome c oxidase subunit I [Bacteroidota bacterium]
MMKKEISIYFILFAIASLTGGVLFGILGAFQFIIPSFFNGIPFIENRPLHVSLVIAWIFMSSVGGIYYYVSKYCNVSIYSLKLVKVHLWVFIIIGLLVVGSYLSGKFGGREYWEFPPVFAIPIILSWIMFGYNFFRTVFGKKDPWPVYIWMWGTGIFFFLFTYMESNLWVFPYFRDNLVRDLTVQWKAGGSLVGSWNMLIYGTAIFLMDRIKNDHTISTSTLAFVMYFLGLINLIFNWAHHIYIVPNALWIRYIAYGISMTELIILGKIIWNWKKNLTKSRQDFHLLAVRFIVASDVWILLNLVLAISLSIPAVNIFTHGTHLTVAHAMGSTIGINTMILIASCLFMIPDITGKQFSKGQALSISIGFWIMNIVLLFFWLALIFAGILKGYLVIQDKLTFQEIMLQVRPYLAVVAVTGTIIFGGILMVFLPALKMIRQYIFAR